MNKTLTPLQFICKHYGVENQLIQLAEECQELIEQVYAKDKTKEQARNGLIDEIADVYVMLEQVVDALGLRNDVKSRKIYKINRQLWRIYNESKQRK